MERFDGYNREDYYFPRSSKEAFGDFANITYIQESKPKMDKAERAAIIVACILLLAYLITIW